MRKQSFLFILLAVALLAASCQKGELADNLNYGSFKVSGSVLSTSNMVVRYNGDSVGYLKAGQNTQLIKEYISSFQFPAGTGVLALYKDGKLVADTTVTITSHDDSPNIEAIYSDRIKVYGFWKSNTISNYIKVPSDSVHFIINFKNISTDVTLNNVEMTFGYYTRKDYYDPEMDDYITKYTYTQRFNAPVVSLISGTESRLLSLGFNDNNGDPLNLTNIAIQVKNKITGALISDYEGKTDYDWFNPGRGKYYIFNVELNGDTKNGYNPGISSGNEPIN